MTAIIEVSTTASPRTHFLGSRVKIQRARAMKVCLSGLMVLAAGPSLVAAEPPAEIEVRRVIQLFYTAFNSHDFGRAKEFATDDWTHINPFGGVTRGRETVLRELKEVHSTFLKPDACRSARDSAAMRDGRYGCTMVLPIHRCSQKCVRTEQKGIAQRFGTQRHRALILALFQPDPVRTIPPTNGGRHCFLGGGVQPSVAMSITKRYFTSLLIMRS